MVKNVTTEALILSRRDVGEADRLVIFFTKQRGVIRVLAKGVRRIPSRRGGHLEPLTSARVVFTDSGGRYFLVASEIVDYFDHLRADAAALTQAHVIGLLVASLFDEGDAQPDLFRVVATTWRMLPTLPSAQRALLEVLMVMLCLQCAGLLPALTTCCRCGCTASVGDVVLDGREGGWACGVCSAMLPSAAYLSPRLLDVLRLVVAAPHRVLQAPISEQDSWRLAYALRSYTATLVGGPVQHSMMGLVSPSLIN